MTSTDEARFITLWQQGLSHEAMAQQLGIPVGTVKSRAHALQRQGKIQAKPRGRQRALVRPERPAPVQRPVQTTDTGAVQPFDTGAVQRLDRLEDELQGLRHLVQALMDRFDHPPVQTPVQITTLPLYPKGKAVQTSSKFSLRIWLDKPTVSDHRNPVKLQTLSFSRGEPYPAAMRPWRRVEPT
jgi:transposase